MSTQYPVLGNRPINQWKVTELKEELRRRKITTKGLKEDLVKRLSEAVLSELAAERELNNGLGVDSEPENRPDEVQSEPVADYNSEPVEDKNQNVFNDSGMVDNNLDVNQEIREQLVKKKGITYSSGLVKEATNDVVGQQLESIDNRNVTTELESSGQASSYSEKNGVSEAPAENVSVSASEPSNHVAEVSPDLGFSVKCESTFTENSSYNQKNVALEPPAEDVSVSASEPSNQVSEVRPDLGFAVKCESMFTEDSSYSKKNEASKPAVEDVSLGASEPSNQVSEVSPDLGFAVKCESILAESSSYSEKHEGSKSPAEDFPISKSEPRNQVSGASPDFDFSIKCESMYNEDLSYSGKNEDSKPPPEDTSISLSEPSNQVSEVRPDLGFEVKYQSIFSDSVSINEKHELKDNSNADDLHLELGVVKLESEQPSSSDSPPEQEGGEKQGSSVEFDSVTNATDLDFIKQNDSAEGGSPEKLNLDRSSGDESMEEDVVESKQIGSSDVNDGIGGTGEICNLPVVEIDNPIDAVAGKFSPEKESAIVAEETRPEASSEKRNLGDKGFQVNESKRQRRWNPETIKSPEPQAYNLISDVPKDTSKLTAKPSVTRSDSKISEDATKDRIVPLSKEAPTTSLRIDRFLRPFTLKAVQELLAKTGTVCNFWMDQIKTHCYVTYSSVEEAVATRNAVYNLQWPPNGGRFLVAEFVDPQEVKLRVEGPPHSRAPAVPSPVAPATPSSQPPHQNDLRQKLPPAQRHPLPANQANPPPLRERLPPPPTFPEKSDPPILTLDDLFQKTRATPRIYYLPLSEEQVAAKLSAEGKNIQ